MRDTEMEMTVALGALVLSFGEPMFTDAQLAALKQYTAAVREDERERAVARVRDKAFSVSLHGITNDQSRIVTLAGAVEAIRHA